MKSYKVPDGHICLVGHGAMKNRTSDSSYSNPDKAQREGHDI